MKEGRELEKLIAVLEKIVSADPATTVESPYMAIDRTTGSQREHDVGIRIKREHHEFVVAIECRDRSRNVTVPEVEAFSQKCGDTNINKGVIVSSKGFAEDALIKAKHLNIDCYTLQEAQEFSWLQLGAFSEYSTEILSNAWSFIPKENFEKKPVKFHVEGADGVVVDTRQLDFAAFEQVRKRENDFFLKVGIHRLPINFLLDGFFIVDDDTGQKRALSHAEVLIEVKISLQEKSMSKVAYRNVISEKNAIEAGVVSIDANGIAGNLLFVSGSNGITVSFQPKAAK